MILIYALLALILTWPLAAQLNTAIPAGAGGDVWVHEWTFWWIERAIGLGQNPFYTDLLFYPHGVSLTTHNIAWFNIGLWFPLQATLGNSIAYSLTYPIIFVLNGLSLYLLALHWLGGNRRTAANQRASSRLSHAAFYFAAFIAGLIYAFWPYLTSQSGHPNMMTVGWLPLALLYLMRTLEGGTWRDALWAGFFMAMQGIARWQLLIIGGLVLGIYVLFTFCTERLARTLGTVAKLALSGSIALLLMAPLGAPLVMAQLSRVDASSVLIDDGVFGVDLLAMVIPNANLGLWSHLVEELPQHLQFRHDQVDFMGYTALLLAIIGALWQRRRAAVWVIVALVLSALAIGSQLTVAHQTYGSVSTPYRWVQDISLIRVVRAPHRFYAFMALPLGLLAAQGVLALRRRRRPVALIATVAALLIAAEYWVLPYRMAPLETPAWYSQLATEPGEFGILGLPMSPRLADKFYMHYQITHGKALVEGHVSRPPNEAFAFLESSDFLRKLHLDNVLDPNQGDVTHQLRVLADVNVRYVILHKNLATAEQIAAWRAWLFYAPQYEDDEVIAYSTAPQLGTDYETTHVLTPALGLASTGVESSNLRQTEPLRVFATWVGSEAMEQDRQTCVRLMNGAGETAQKSCADVGTMSSVPFPTSQWQAGELLHERYDFRLDPFLPPGNYAVLLSLEEGTGNTVPDETVVAGALTVEALPRQYDLPQPTIDTSVNLSDTMRFHGADLAQNADELQITLYWQARQRTERSYKVFAHLVRAIDGSPVAQWDGIPGQWSYPTTWWDAGEVVADTVVLPLADVAAGEYRLLVGMYDEATGVRLPVSATELGAAEAVGEDVIVVTTIEHDQE